MESSEFKSGSVVKDLQDTLRNEVDQMECVIHAQMNELFVVTLRFHLQREHGGSSHGQDRLISLTFLMNK